MSTQSVDDRQSRLDLGQRLARLRDRLGLRLEEANTRLGWARGTWGNFERGDRLPTTEHLLVLNKELNLNPAWLLTGEGPMFSGGEPEPDSGRAPVSDPELAVSRLLREQVQELRADKQRLLEEVDRLRRENSELRERAAASMDSGTEESPWEAIPGTLRSEGKRLVPLYNARPAAGPGQLVLEEEIEDKLPVSAKTILEIGAFPEDLFAVRVGGESMEPTIQDGQIVLCDRMRYRAQGLMPGIYIFRWDAELYIKELVPQEEGGAIAISHNPNPKFKPIEIPAEPPEGSMQVIGRVVKLWRRG